MAVAAVAGIAVGAAGKRATQYIKGRQLADDADHGTLPPAGWYADSLDPTRLRYWSGTAWTDHVAQRRPVPATPAGWYPDPVASARLRYWDGRVWTNHFASRSGVPVATRRVGTSEARPNSPQVECSRMTRAGWQAHVRGWMAAAAMEQELWRRLCNAHIVDADDSTLLLQREMRQLTPEQGASRVRSMLAASPAPGAEAELAQLMRSLIEPASELEPQASEPLGLRRGMQGSTHERDRRT